MTVPESGPWSDSCRCSGRMSRVAGLPLHVALAGEISHAGHLDTVSRTRTVQQIAGPDEVRDEDVGRMVVERGGIGYLLYCPFVQHGDAIGHRHRLLLVVGHDGKRDADLVLKALELPLHLCTHSSCRGPTVARRATRVWDA